jgi:CheY-like chemotaxis protein
MGIIRNHHGLIEVETALDQGTCFRVYLPATTDEARPQPTKSDDLPHGRGQRLLLVDDEAYFLEVVRDSLNLLAYQVIACGSSLQALDLIRADPDGFDLVITDQTMPEMTGTQLVREIRAAGGRQPVILCTGFSATINQDNIGAHGIARLLLKPVTIDELARAVREVLAPEPSATGAGHAA